MPFEIETRILNWLISLQLIHENQFKQLSTSTFQVIQTVANKFQNGLRIALIVGVLYKQRNMLIPEILNHLKESNHTASELYNWNIINEVLRKIDYEVNSQSKNLIINGNRQHLSIVMRQLYKLYTSPNLQDSLEQDTEQMRKQVKQHKKNNNIEEQQNKKQQQQQQQEQYQQQQQSEIIIKEKQQQSLLILSKSNNINNEINKLEKKQNIIKNDLLEYIILQIIKCLKLNRKQSITLLSNNNKYLSHVLVKGMKNQFNQIELLMKNLYNSLDYIIQRMIKQNDMCFLFLQLIKPSLLSKNQEIAQWGCRILTKISYELSNKDMLPLAYDWFVKQNGGLSTTILALQRHPKLNQFVVNYILQFGRYNVSQLFTVELKKITYNDNITYVKFILLIFESLVSSKISSQELLNSGAIDYWVQMSLKGSQNISINSYQYRLYCMQFLIKIWKSYPIHIEQTLDQVNTIMTNIKKGIHQNSYIMRFTLLELLFHLLDNFAINKNPFASIVYKKLTFLFIENHQQQIVRQFMLRNFIIIFIKFISIPIEIFLQPFIKQIKISQSKSYLINIFDMQFILIAVKHHKLKINIGLELYDLLAKIKLNSYIFSQFTQQAINILLDRFLNQDLFFQYTIKLVKISLTMFYSTLKNKKKTNDNNNIFELQKRSQIINLILSLINHNNKDLNKQIKQLIIYIKLQIQNKLKIQHKGIQKILNLYPNINQQINIIKQNNNNNSNSNSNQYHINQKNINHFHLPKIQNNHYYRDQISSQQSSNSSNSSKYSKVSKQEFPHKDYSKFAEQNENKFMKQHGINMRKKKIKKSINNDKELLDPKVQEQLYRIKQKKQDEMRKKLEEKRLLERKKQMLKMKIQKQLEQRNIKGGIKGYERDVETKIIFQQNQINDKILEDELEFYRNIDISEEEIRNSQSIHIVLKKYSVFLKRIFTKFSCEKIVKKDYFQGQNQNMTLVNLIRFCKQKNLEKNKQPILEILKITNNKNISQISIESFFKFLQVLCIALYHKQKCMMQLIMGEHMKNILKRIAVGENIKFEEEQDQKCRILTEKIKYNSQSQLPQNYKKVTQKVYYQKQQCTYHVQKSINQKYIVCFEAVNDIIWKALGVNVIEEQVIFADEIKVVSKKIAYLPPKQIKKEQSQAISLLEPKQSAPLKKIRMVSSVKKRNSVSREKQNSKPKVKVLNAAEKKRLQQQRQKIQKKEQEQEQRKLRQIQIRKKLKQQEQLKQRQKQKMKLEVKQQKSDEQKKKEKQKEDKEKYQQRQKDKLEKYKKNQQEKQKKQDLQQKQDKSIEEEKRKQKLKQQLKKQQQRRKDQADRIRKQRVQSVEKNQRKKQDDQKKKQNLKKQVMKKLQNEKQKYELIKMQKQLLKKIFIEESINEIFNNYKEQLKALFNYAKQYNDYKLGDISNQNTIEHKGWLTICQQLGICDTLSANKVFKTHQKQKGTNGFTFEQFLQTLLSIATKKQLQNEKEDYGEILQTCINNLDKFIKGFKLPKDKQSLKDFFSSMKKNSGKREEIGVINPNGQKETWQLEQKK